jgi:dephospho-CoA kinase
MKSFKDILEENMNEALITFNKKSYPRFGNVVILAGGAGSGKGFVKDKLLGIEGKTLDVDHLKTLVMASWKLSKKIKDETGHDIKTFDLKKPENVSMLHSIVKKYHLDEKTEKSLFNSIVAQPKDKKQNIIFDVTLKDITKLNNITHDIVELGYDRKNIHIVWVINKVEIAKIQNKSRERIVPEDILLDTHKGASSTMKDILDMGDNLKKYMDGDIWFAFNAIGIDSEIAKSENGGSYIKKANYIKVKEAGKKQKSSEELGNEIYNKIKSYVPSSNQW